MLFCYNTQQNIEAEKYIISHVLYLNQHQLPEIKEIKFFRPNEIKDKAQYVVEKTIGKDNSYNNIPTNSMNLGDLIGKFWISYR